jgi:hypothetical protein
VTLRILNLFARSTDRTNVDGWGGIFQYDNLSPRDRNRFNFRNVMYINTPEAVLHGCILSVSRRVVELRYDCMVRHLLHSCYLDPRHNGNARPRVTDGGGGVQVWRVAANILNDQSRAPDKEWSFGLGIGRGTNNSSP